MPASEASASYRNSNSTNRNRNHRPASYSKQPKPTTGSRLRLQELANKQVKSFSSSQAPIVRPKPPQPTLAPLGQQPSQLQAMDAAVTRTRQRASVAPSLLLLALLLQVSSQMQALQPAIQMSRLDFSQLADSLNGGPQQPQLQQPSSQFYHTAGPGFQSQQQVSSASSNYARIMQQNQAYMQAQCPVLASLNPHIIGLQQPVSPAHQEQVGGHCPQTREGLLNVHIICHTHLDTGWVETFDQYYYGYVETIINSVVKSLLENPRRRFIFVEMSFFMRWWRDQNELQRARFRKLVNNGQMEFISGGWSMNDEAVSHYSAVIDQMTLGHKNLHKLFGQCGGIPKIGWQIDPFGHSREYASLLTQMGFEALFLGRIDFQDKIFRQNMQSMEFVWKSSPSLGAYKSDLFTSVLPNTYSPPDKFCFDVNCNDEQLNRYNIQQKASHFALMMLKQAETYATNHTIVTMGMDFYYRDANKWYTNLDMLVDEIQSNPFKYKINLVYSTPSCYLKNLHKQSHVTWPVKLDDFFPYADAHNSYWTGYYTSRPGLKYQIVMGNNFLQAAKQLSVLANPMSNQDAVLELESLQETLGILQHHDAVTGTCKQFVNDDYSHMLANAMKKAHHSLVTSVAKIIEFNNGQRMAALGANGSPAISPIDAFIMKGEHIFCSSLNASHCQISEKLDRVDKLLIHVYNPASHTVQHYVQIPVRDGRFVVRESNGNTAIASQQIPIPPSVLRLTLVESRQDYGVIDPEVSKEFIFAAILPPLTMATYVIEKLPPISTVPGSLGAQSALSSAYSRPFAPHHQHLPQVPPRFAFSQQQQQQHANNIVRRELLPTPNTANGDIVFGNSRISGVIDQNTGLLKAIQFADGRRLPFRQNLYYYDADGRYRPEKNSGAYIFNPTDRGSQKIAQRAEIEVVRGPVVEEVHQVFSPWASQVIRIYKHSDYIEFHWLVGPIPIQADLNSPNGAYSPMSDNGREIVSIYETDMKTNGTFFTDSNGRETIRRVRDHRTDYRLFTSERMASNYYPITSWIFIRDYERNLQMSILPDRPEGGSSLHDGQIELMLHRRLLQDDGLGMEEPLNEPGIDRRGLIIRGKHHLLIGPIDSVIRSTRQLSKQLHMHPIQWFQAPPSSMNLGLAALQPNGLLSSAGAVGLGSGVESSTGGFGAGNFLQNRFKFNGLRDYLPKMVNLLSLESWDPDTVLIRLEHIFEINEDADYSRPVQVSLRRMFKNIKIIKVRETTLDGLQDIEVARVNRLRFQTSNNPYKNYTDELGDFVNMDYVSHLMESASNTGEDLFIVELRPMEIRTFLVQIQYG